MSIKNLEMRRLLKSLPLFGFSITEMLVAFVRMFILTHILGSYEFGFAAAISATYATIEQIADLAIFRFVSSSPRLVHSEAIAAAHALTILRGIFLASCVLIFSYPIACTFAGCNNWASFAWLAPVIMIRSLEHLDIRVGERDYRYGPQLLASFVSHSFGVLALVIIAYRSRSHYAFVAYLLIQAAVYLVASHLLASIPYQTKLNTPYLRKAFAFGFPLMVNGVGLAIVGQGDRLMVGALLGLPTLGLYAVVVLAGLVPISGILRILGPLYFAGLHNAKIGGSQYIFRLRLFSRLFPIVAGCYSLTLIILLKTVVQFVFGPRFVVSDSAVLLIALIAFFRIVRIEPHTSLLLNVQRTRELAFANLSTGVGLLLASILVLLKPAIEAVLTGILFGELVGIIVMVFTTRHLLKVAIFDYVFASILAVMIVIFCNVLIMTLGVSDNAPIRLAISFALYLLILAAAWTCLFELYRSAYRENLHR